MAKFIFLIIIIALSTSWLYLLHFFAPSLNENDDVKDHLKFPNNLEELQNVAEILKSYSVKHWWYVLLIFGSAYIYKQTFCIPGSLFLNLLAGSLYGKVCGLFFACLFTAIGASFCYLLSLLFAKDLVTKYFPDKFSSFEAKVNENKENLLSFMLCIRLVPIAPGWVINIVSPLLSIPFPHFVLTTFFGLCPYNFVGVSAGGMLSTLKSIDDVFTWNVLFSITTIAVVSSGPAYLLKKIRDQRKMKVP